jgi:hypothetical protein
MAVFASGKHALAVSDRSGLVFPYLEMVREWNGAWVHHSEFEPKQPQLDPKPTSADPQALQRARPTRVALPTPATLNDNPFLTEIGTTVTVTQTGHGRSTNDAVRFYQVKTPVGGVAVSTFELNTTLNGDITAAATSLILTSSAEFPPTGYIVVESTNTDTSSLAYGRITSETIQYTANNTGTNTLSGLTRGTAAPSQGNTPVSTTAVAHTSGEKVYGSYPITIINETRVDDAGTTVTFSNRFSFTLVSAATSIETGGGFFVFGGPVNDRP